MKTVACHLMRSLSGTFEYVAQVATEETKKSSEFFRYPIVNLNIPETGILEVIQVFDNIIDFGSFTKCGLVTEEQAEERINPPQYKQDVTSWHTLARLLVATKQAKGFVQQPYPLDECGYKNISPTYYFPDEFYREQGIGLVFHSDKHP